MAVRLQSKVRERGLGLRFKLNSGPVSDAQRRSGGILLLLLLDRGRSTLWTSKEQIAWNNSAVRKGYT